MTDHRQCWLLLCITSWLLQLLYGLFILGCGLKKQSPETSGSQDSGDQDSQAVHILPTHCWPGGVAFPELAEDTQSSDRECRAGAWEPRCCKQKGADGVTHVLHSRTTFISTLNTNIPKLSFYDLHSKSCPWTALLNSSAFYLPIFPSLVLETSRDSVEA